MSKLLKGRLQFAGRTDNSYSPFGHGIFVFRKKSARVGNQLTISLDGHRIGTSLPRFGTWPMPGNQFAHTGMIPNEVDRRRTVASLLCR